MAGPIVGIDFGATGIRAVEVTGTSRGLKVRAAAAVPLSPGAIEDGSIKDPAAVAAALKSLFRKGRFRTRKVATVIGADPGVVVRTAPVPLMANPADQRALVLEAAPEVLPVTVANSYVDYHVMDVRTEPQPDGTSADRAYVSVVAADRSDVDAVVQALEMAGLVALSIDITTFTLARLVAQASSGPGHLDAIAHIGANTVSLIGTADGQPVFERSLKEYAGARVTSAVQEVLGCSPEQAERFKIDAAQLTGPEAPTVNQVVDAWTAATVNAILDALVRDARHAGLPIGRVWLSGGGARLGTLARRLKAQIAPGAQVAVIDPAIWVTKPERLVRASQSTGQDFTVALAASIR